MESKKSQVPGGSCSPMGELKTEGLNMKEMPTYRVEGSISVPKKATDKPKKAS